jgi:MFS family permease
MSSASGQRPRLPVLKFYLYAASGRAAFTVPVFVLFFRARGLTFAEIGAVEATYTVVVLLAETPTGYLGDRLGRRRSMLLGSVLSAAGAVGYALAHSFAAFLAVSALRAVAGAFRSGATDAWLYETLAGADDGDAFADVRGRASALGIATHGVAAVAGGALYAVDPLLPWLAEAAVVAAGALVLLTVPDAPGEDGDGDRSLVHLARVARRTLTTRALGAFVVYTALLFGLLNTLEMFVQPVGVAVLGIDPTDLGALYAGFAVLSAALASQAGRIRETLGTRLWFGLVPPLLGLLLALVVVEPWLALAGFVAARGVGAVSRPLANQYLNDHSPTAGRATVLSAASMVRSVVTAPLNVAGGALAGAVALTHALGGLGVALAVGALLLLAWRVPVVDSATPVEETGN